MLHKPSTNAHTFYLCALLLTAIFLIARLSFFLYYPAVRIAPDTDSYINLVTAIKSGETPQFITRTPGYPLFIWFIITLFNRWLAVIITQNLLTLTSSIFLIYGVNRLHHLLTLPATLAMAGFVSSTQVLYYDSYLLSESLYTSCIIFSFGSLLLAFASRRPVYFGLASAFMAITILVRPAGMYFAAIYLLILGYLLWNKQKKSIVAGFLIPFPAVLLLLCAYNYLTINTFAISTFGEVNLALATIPFWETDPEFPTEINDAIKKLPELLSERIKFTEKDKMVIENSWDARELYMIFKKSYNNLFSDYAYGEGENFEAARKKGYVPSRDIIRKIIFSSIKKHPTLYAKFVWANLLYFFPNINVHFDFYEYQTSTINGYLRRAGKPSDNSLIYMLATEYKKSNAGETPALLLENKILKSLRITLQSWQWNIFQREAWVWAYFIAFTFSTTRLVSTKGKQLGSFILFILTITVIGSALTTSLVEVSVERYAYPTQFIYYLSTALLPLLWTKEENLITPM